MTGAAGPAHARAPRPVRVHRVPDDVWTPVAAALVVAVPGLAGLATGRLLLLPSLAPTALMQAHSADDPSAGLRNVVLSHLLGLGSAFAAVALLGMARAPSVFEVGALSGPRVAAAVLAVALAAALEMLLRVSHPPAASTTLLAALGSFPATTRWSSASKRKRS